MALTGQEIKYLLSLHNKRKRAGKKQFLLEGVRLLEEALAADYLPRALFYAPSETNERGQKLIRGFIARGIEAQTISARECRRLADTKSPQGIVALFDAREFNLEQQLAAQPRRILVCDRIADPGNLGTLIRSAAAFNFNLVITTDGSAEIANPKTIRATMGGFFKIPMISGVNDIDLSKRLKKSGYKIYSADVRGKDIGRYAPRADKAALVIGSEAAGSGHILADGADYRIKIPMSKNMESLNAAVAGSILMFWINTRERIKK